MIRAAFAIMAGLLCALAGMRHAASLHGDAIRLVRWQQILAHLSLLLREGTLSIPEALFAAADGSRQPDRLLQEIAAQIQTHPLLTLADLFRRCSLDCIEQETLLRLFTRLSRGTRESRLLALEQARGEIQLLAASASQKAAKDARLWQTLGLTGGVCLSLLLL